MIKGVAVRRVVLVAEAAAEKILLECVERLFHAYDVVNCVGRGRRPVVNDFLTESSHVRIEALGSESAVEGLMSVVHECRRNQLSITCFMDLVTANEGVPGPMLVS